jgi:hypothetical protein
MSSTPIGPRTSRTNDVAGRVHDDATPTTKTTSVPAPVTDVQARAVDAPVVDAAAQKAVGKTGAVANVAHALGDIARLAIDHPLGALGVAGAAAFVVGAFGLVSPFVGLMGGGVVSVILLHGGGSQGDDDR